MLLIVYTLPESAGFVGVKAVPSVSLHPEENAGVGAASLVEATGLDELVRDAVASEVVEAAPALTLVDDDDDDDDESLL